MGTRDQAQVLRPAWQALYQLIYLASWGTNIFMNKISTHLPIDSIRSNHLVQQLILILISKTEFIAIYFLHKNFKAVYTREIKQDLNPGKAKSVI